MSDNDDDIVVAEGPLFLLWSTQELGGHALYAQWNGFTFDLYGDPEQKLWFGEAETLEDVDDWAWEVLAEHDRLPLAVADYVVVGPFGRAGRGEGE